MTDDMQPDEAIDADLFHVAIWVCKQCLEGEPGECHTPGCIQFLRSDTDNERLDFEHRYEVIQAANPDRVASRDDLTDVLQTAPAGSGSVQLPDDWRDRIATAVRINPGWYRIAADAAIAMIESWRSPSAGDTPQAEANILDRIVEPEELRDLPPEVIRLVHAVDRMRDKWAEGGDGRKAEQWRRVHEACDGVWGRFDDRPAGDTPEDCGHAEHVSQRQIDACLAETPRTWPRSVPEPGPGVTSVRDSNGRTWVRDRGGWNLREYAGLAEVDGIAIRVMGWLELLELGPLTETRAGDTPATPSELPVAPNLGVGDTHQQPARTLPTTREELAEFFGPIRLPNGAGATGAFVQLALDMLTEMPTGDEPCPDCGQAVKNHPDYLGGDAHQASEESDS